MAKRWNYSTGEYGSKVTAFERGAGGIIYLKAGGIWKSLGHRDRERAKIQARELSTALLQDRAALAERRLTLRLLFDRYLAEVTPTKSPAYRRRDQRRVVLWTHVLGGDFDPSKLTRRELDRFQADRAAGRLGEAFERKKGAVRARTIRADLQFLQAVLRWASSAIGPRLLDRNPMEGYPLPIEQNPRQPLMSHDRHEKLLARARVADPLFPAFLRLLEALGWRVTSVCDLRASDFDLGAYPHAPFGRIRKRARPWSRRKEDRERWVPLSEVGRAAVDEVLRISCVAGDVRVFDGWDRYTARRLLLATEKLAGLPHDRGGFHAWRRKWATERKHLPRSDVAAAGGWESERTLEIYDRPDESTMFEVVSEPRKLREARDG